ncbi:copper resistance CopC family protein [Streptomyces acidicola]|uniref:Copper resistance protein CopC n=1 Tax=Streptomyces acidicola TaxID=2596892 RepID=A0A5N8WTB0_9ACTN|nr:copper resistance protein CopC [Streptomyces acidicola]MPY49844.1 copper resistance protein CopC [Streptomyces acidicola]
MRRLLITLLVVCAGALSAPTPALAHTTLLRGSPGPGDSVAPGLKVMALTFGPLLEPSPDAVGITGPSGTEVASGAPVVVSDGGDGGDGDGNDTLCLAVDALDEPGTYTVSYSLRSADGDPLESAFQFAVDKSAGAATAAPECSGKTLPDPGTASGTAGTQEQGQEQAEAQGQGQTESADTGAVSGLSGTQWAIVGGGAGAALLFAAFMLLAEGRRGIPPRRHEH